MAIGFGTFQTWSPPSGGSKLSAELTSVLPTSESLESVSARTRSETFSFSLLLLDSRLMLILACKWKLLYSSFYFCGQFLQRLGSGIRTQDPLFWSIILLTTKPPRWTLCQALCPAKFCLPSFVCVAKQFISFNLPGFNNSRNFFYILLIKVGKLGLFCWKRTHEKTFIFL